MRYLFALVLLLTTVAAGAQLSYGPRAGINIAKIKFSNDQFKTKSLIGFSIGGFANYRLSPSLAIQAEVFYSGEGTKEERSSSSTKGTIRKGYLQVPVLAQYTIGKGVFVEAGPQIGFLMSSKEKYGGQKEDIKKYYNSTDLRLPVGVGYIFPESVCKGLRADLRYSFSFSKVNKVSVGGGELKNQVLGIGFFYTLPAGKK
ncbi:MAG: porin family protein [Chitinophagaceae bacterium]